MTTESVLSKTQQAVVPIAAFTATGDLPKLNASLKQGLDAGLSISETKEILVQMYAYAGFPRSLNALAEFMKVLNERKQQGIIDVAGREPMPLPAAPELLALGTANQTQLAGAPVKGALFEFAPAIDVFLKTHLFGDIFGRDNLDWQRRELATVGALATMQGAESQLQSHLAISMNTGLTEGQLRQVIQLLSEQVDAGAAQRTGDALVKHLASFH